MLGPLLAKDLLRARRNPVPWLIHLALPLLVTGLIGFTFGRPNSGGGLGTISVALVDEDDTPLSEMLKGAMNQREAGQHLDLQILSREEAVRRINDNRLSAVCVIPAGFTRAYLDGESTVAFELIKNPAQTFHPAIVEEFLGLLTTGLNALGRTLRPEFPAWRRLFSGEDAPDLLEIGRMFQSAGTRMEAVRPYLNPPLLRYTKRSESAAGTASDAEEEKDPKASFDLFAFLMLGMMAMFLLFIADNAVRDLYRELDRHTLERFHTLRQNLFLFVVSKAVLAMALLLVAATIMLGAGSLIFRIEWRTPGLLALLVVAYALCGTGLMSLLAAIAGSERRADLFNTLVAMGLGLAGGCMFPPQQLPALFRETIMPWLPTAWFAETARSLQGGWDGPAWSLAVLKLVLLGLFTLVAAGLLFRRRLEKGVRT